MVVSYLLLDSSILIFCFTVQYKGKSVCFRLILQESNQVSILFFVLFYLNLMSQRCIWIEIWSLALNETLSFLYPNIFK